MRSKRLLPPKANSGTIPKLSEILVGTGSYASHSSFVDPWRKVVQTELLNLVLRQLYGLISRYNLVQLERLLVQSFWFSVDTQFSQSSSRAVGSLARRLH